MRRPKRELKKYLYIAERAAIKAGALLSGPKRKMRAVNIDVGRDIKIGADVESEETVVRHLRDRSPFPILTEERGYIKAARYSGGISWIVDPLDGSMNYLRGIPICCVSIALWENGRPLLGTIYDFNRKELFCGGGGIGARLNGREIRTSDTENRGRATLLTGFPAKTDFSPRAVSSFVKKIRSYKKVRLLGSAALSLAYVACGRADAYIENNIMLWDVAAGSAIIEGAGGRCNMTGLRDGTVKIRACNSRLKRI